MDYGETNRSSSSSSYAGYEGTPKDSYNDYPSSTFGQKFAGQATYKGSSLAPSFGQRLALAIVSLSLLLVALIISLVWVATSQYFSPVQLIATIGFVLFFIAVIVINLMFNRR